MSGQIGLNFEIRLLRSTHMFLTQMFLRIPNMLSVLFFCDAQNSRKLQVKSNVTPFSLYSSLKTPRWRYFLKFGICIVPTQHSDMYPGFLIFFFEVSNFIIIFLQIHFDILNSDFQSFENPRQQFCRVRKYAFCHQFSLKFT